MDSSLIEKPISIEPYRTKFQQLNNVIKRVIMATVMISSFLIIISMGPLMLIFLMFIIEVFSFSEVLKIGYNNLKIPPSVPHFRSLSWYFLVAANYFFFVETVAPHFQDFYQKVFYLEIMVKYHRFISFCIYLIGIVLFDLNLVRKYDSKQFRILAWTHTLLIIIVLQSYMVVENIFNGIIWFILPVSMVVLNDIFAFIFGRMYGKTPLIELSPKKTWEGFIGGVIGTLASSFMLSSVMCQYKYFVCPVKYYEGDGLQGVTDCTLSYLFTPTTYSLWFLSVNYYPFYIHCLSLALFASIIAPFGGFCASGFKRAFKVKDFGDVIPGHGGMMDRMDCQFLMATFVNVYIFTFVRSPSVDLIFEKVHYLDESSQVQFYYMLRDALRDNSYFDNVTDIH